MLAIVIPFYKLTFFEETLKSLSYQTDNRFIVYIGDDASSENPTCVLEKYKTMVDFVYKRFETNLGGVSLVKQWERCIEMVAAEDWIMILGDDDTLGDNCVASFYSNIIEVEHLNINVIRYASFVINQNNEKLSNIYKHPKLEKSTDFLIRKFSGGTRSSLSEFVFKKEVLLDVKFKDLPLAWYSDLLGVLEVSKFGLIYTINGETVSFRLSGINITSKTDNLLLKNKATFEFYYYLLNEKSKFFNYTEKSILMLKLEKTFLDNKKNITFWVLFTKLYLSNFYFKNYYIFIDKMVKAFFLKK
ncbi:glycosyltransferase [Flavobacterium sp. LB2R40]|uniref:glycosyltransferase n=1 Tax=Flavobacterium sp. LB2R40 TaxID=3401722 RepID=UPI003AAF3539